MRNRPFFKSVAHVLIEKAYRLFRNMLYVRHFPQDQPLPSRTIVGVAALGRCALVEIDLVCFKPT